MKHFLSLLYLASLSGLLAILFDILIRQSIVAPIIENKHLSEECKLYRKTREHMLAVFLVGFFIFLIIKLGFKLKSNIINY